VPYYLAIRGSLPTGAYGNSTCQDGSSIRPSDVSSNLTTRLSGAPLAGVYSHFGGNSTHRDTNNPVSSGSNCIVGDNSFWGSGANVYHYYIGGNTSGDLGNVANYIVSANASENLLAWRRVSLACGGCATITLGNQHLHHCFLAVLVAVHAACMTMLARIMQCLPFPDPVSMRCGSWAIPPTPPHPNSVWGC
jgi:hypothetical protein